MINQGELYSVRETIGKYIKGVTNADIDLLEREVFHDDATMSGSVQGHDILGGPSIIYKNLNSKNPIMVKGDNPRAEILDIKQKDDRAQVKLYQSGYLKGEEKIDYFILIRDNDNTWKVISKIGFSLE